MSAAAVLIVDDEKTQREGLRAALEDNYDIYLADSAAAAMESAFLILTKTWWTA